MNQKHVDDPSPLVVTKAGILFTDQAEGLRQFKGACAGAARTQREQYFPGTARMFTHAHRMAVSKDWLAGWDACLAEIDKRGGFVTHADGEADGK